MLHYRTCIYAPMGTKLQPLMQATCWSLKPYERKPAPDVLQCQIKVRSRVQASASASGISFSLRHQEQGLYIACIRPSLAEPPPAVRSTGTTILSAGSVAARLP